VRLAIRARYTGYCPVSFGLEAGIGHEREWVRFWRPCAMGYAAASSVASRRWNDR
jgi:hypothetical protein